MANEIKQERRTERKSSGGSLFTKLENGIDLDSVFDKYFTGKNLGYLIYVLIIGLLYISNSHVND